MTLQAPKGTRDFYPDDFARLNAIFDAWRRVSIRNGLAEIDGPAFEMLELYTAKSGEEIVSQLFRVVDRGGRDLALRPELTPSLARMVNQRVSSLSLPIKWFAIPRLWRAENVQRGRLREFFQWNVDIVGSAEPVADAECIFVAIDLLRELGLTAQDVVVKISSRPLLAAVLVEQGVPADQLNTLYTVIDKQAKMPAEKFRPMLVETLTKVGVAETDRVADELIAATGCCELAKLPIRSEPAIQQRAALEKLFALLADFGVADYCQFDLGVVRGLAYYTGPVFEIYDRKAELRAIAGGGRYDNLLETLGGPAMPAVGFGMGDVVLSDLLETLGKLPTGRRRVDAFLIDAEERFFPQVVRLAGQLRAAGISAVFGYRRSSVSRQFKQANQASARFVIVVGQEIETGQVTVKNLASGEQTLCAIEPLDSLVRQLSADKS